MMTVPHLCGEFTLSERDAMMTTSCTLMEPLAAKGDTTAMIRLADCYRRGFGVTVDLPRAFKLFLQAARMGRLNACNSVALRYGTCTLTHRSVGVVQAAFI
jgi:TPR repeat protein